MLDGAALWDCFHNAIFKRWRRFLKIPTQQGPSSVHTAKELLQIARVQPGYPSHSFNLLWTTEKTPITHQSSQLFYKRCQHGF